jgi:hypothetical protein
MADSASRSRSNRVQFLPRDRLRKLRAISRESDCRELQILHGLKPNRVLAARDHQQSDKQTLHGSLLLVLHPEAAEPWRILAGHRHERAVESCR